MKIVIVSNVVVHLFLLNHCEAGHLGQGSGMSCKMGEQLLLAEENGGIIGVRCAPKLYAEKAAIRLPINVFGGEVTF